MSATETIVRDGTLASNYAASGIRGVDPRRRRFGLNPGIYQCQLDPRESGRQEILLPVGLIAFRTAEMANDDFNHVMMNGQNPNAQSHQIREDVTAFQFLSNFLTRYSEAGARELTSLTMMDDAVAGSKKSVFNASAQGYFAALWPSFAEIGHVCPADLKECVTCRLWLLGDPDEDDKPMQEVVFDLASKLDDQDKVDELRLEIVECLKAYEATLTSKWASLTGEMGDRKTGAPGIGKLGPSEHHVRQNLHEVEPSEAATAASFGMEVAQANADATKELAQAFREGKGGPNDEAMKMILENQKQQAEILARLSERLPESKDPA